MVYQNAFDDSMKFGILDVVNPTEIDKHILPQSSGDFDPEADPDLKKSPEYRSGGILRNFVFRSGLKLW